MKRFACLLSALLILAACIPGAASGNSASARIPIRVLIIPKFEIDGITGDFPGEAQLYYEKYCPDCKAGRVPHLPDAAEFYVNRESGAAVLLTGPGKLAASMSLMAVLSCDDCYDFSDTMIVSIGCAGGSAGHCTLGDIVVVTAVCDYDLGHKADPREMEDIQAATTWFHDSEYDEYASRNLNAELCDSVYRLIQDCPLRTTENARRVMSENFAGTEYRTDRDPAVIRGTSVTGDSFWKGRYDHANACRTAEVYKCPDPYIATEMEEIAVANAADCFGLLDRLISLRVIVNMDVFLNGDTPESLWGGDVLYNEKVKEENSETLDIFEPAMYNLFDAASIIIDAVLDGKLGDTLSGSSRKKAPEITYRAENRYMQLAIEEAREGIYEDEGGPFGCVIVKDGKVVGRGHHCVAEIFDSTAHSAIEAIRDAEERMNACSLSGCELYTTGEPCLMCLAACLWADIGHVYYGCSIGDSSAAGFENGQPGELPGGWKEPDGYLEQIDRDACMRLYNEYRYLDTIRN